MSDAADWAHYQVGKVFGTRVGPPTSSSNPSWGGIDELHRASRNNALLFCTGYDPTGLTLMRRADDRDPSAGSAICGPDKEFRDA